MPYFSSFGTAFKKTRRKFSAETLSEALWLPFLLASSWHGYQATDWKFWKQDVKSTSRSQVNTVDILLMEEIPSPTTWDVKNLTNNGINYSPQLVGRTSEQSTASCVFFLDVFWLHGIYKLLGESLELSGRAYPNLFLDAP